MSGIAGQYWFDQRPVDPRQLQQVRDKLAHRGPDRQQIWHRQHVGIVHCLLQTTPESLAEQQPWVSPQTGCVITADARLDNRAELIHRLSLNPSDQHSDAALILAAYERWGDRCPEQLLGAFAFVIWDPKRQRLFCARDHFGVKPLFYYRDRDAFYVASEIKAILCCSDVPRQVNEARIADFIQSRICDRTLTIYQGILRLLPGHWLSVSPQGVQKQVYWQPQPVPELALSSNQEYAEAFLEHFTEAVRCRLRSTTAIGSHLSGGLDSSAVTCMARRLLASSTQLHTFSNIYDRVVECDERQYIHPVLEQGGFTPHFVHPDHIGPLTDWPEMIQADEEPCLVGGNGYLVRGLNQAVQAQSLRVCLDGFDGDTTVSHGAPYFAELAAAGNWATFAQEAHAVAPHFKTSAAAILRQYGFSHLRTLAQHRHWWRFAQAVDGIHRQFRVSRKQLWMQMGVKPLLPETGLWPLGRPPQLVAPPLLRTALRARLPAQRCSEQPPSTPQAEQLQTFTSGLFDHVLEQVDLQAATCSIELRHPFMDKRLIEFCLSLPSTQRLAGGWSRLIMRRALEGILPTDVQWRGGKTSMTPNFRQGLLRFNQAVLQAVIMEPSSAAEYIDWTAVQSAYQRLIAHDDATEADLQAIWKGTVLSLWLGSEREIDV